ncbi:hypothetical protein TruAng_003940 [Truncatella angustata]|nr:hypothetical protein TruAng_003940 [Truncatella angustata]
MPTRPTPKPSPCPSIAGVTDMELDLGGIHLHDCGKIARYPPSLESDSTLSAKTYVNQDLKNQVDSIDWMLQRAVEPTQLTVLALQTLDYGNNTHGYHHDLTEWCENGNIFVHGRLHAKLSDSILLPQRARSHITELTSSSYDMLLDVTAANGTDNDISGTGAAFHDVPRAPSFEDDVDMMGT